MKSPFSFNKSTMPSVEQYLSGGNWHVKSVYTSFKILLPLFENHYNIKRQKAFFHTCRSFIVVAKSPASS